MEDAILYDRIDK